MRAFVFPGQGSQKVGMGAELAAASEAARDVFGEVDEALKQSLFALMREGPEDRLTLTENAQPAIMANAMRYFAFIGLLLAGTGALLADSAVALLYGPEYEAVVVPLRVMMVVGGFTMVGGAFNALLSTTDNQRLRVGYVLFSVVSVAVLSVLLIPRYGLNGAVAAHAISEVLIFTLMATGVSRLLKLRVPWRELGRMVACALVAIAVAVVPMLVGGTNFWTELAAGLIYAAVFVLGTVVIRAWRADDVQHLGAMLQRYPGLAGRMQGRLQRWADGLPTDSVR